MNSLKKSFEYDNEISTIKNIRFSLLSPEEIEKRSAVEIKTADTYIGNVPVPHGVFDPRMGATDNKHICPTCNQDLSTCPNHFGHISLARPIFAPSYLNYVKKILKCVCLNCSSLLDPYDTLVTNIANLHVTPHKRFTLIYKHFNKNTTQLLTCHRCQTVQPIYKNKNSAYTIECFFKDENVVDTTTAAADIPDEKLKYYYADMVLPILKRISDKELILLGFNPSYSRPEWMIWTKMVVPPPSVRPSVKYGTGNRGEDDLTVQLCSIIKENNELFKLIKSPTANIGSINSSTKLLQWQITAFIDNKQSNIHQAKQRSGKPLKTLFERIRGKNGRIRTNLLGKRVDHSARTVASSDPYISIDEIGIPYKIAMNLTFPEAVTEFNKEQLKAAITNGTSKYPGAKYIKKKNGVAFAIHEDFNAVEIENGDVVFRHLVDGDPVIVNRQPTLHRMSMMTHRVRVLPYNTFRISVNVTKSYAGDFDGDEFNIHVPQSIQTSLEILSLSDPHTQIISHRDSKPIIWILHDKPIGLYVMTNEETSVSPMLFSNYLCNISGARLKDAAGLVKNHISQNKHQISGKRLFEFLLPKNISTKVGGVTIENGVLTHGRVSAPTYGQKSVGLVHTAVSEYSPLVAKDLIDNTQKLILNWMLDNGFSVGLQDLLVYPEMELQLQTIVKSIEGKVDELLYNIHTNNYNNDSGLSNSDYLEKQLNEIIMEIDVEDKNILSKIVGGKDNRFKQLIDSKSKGSDSNLLHMVSILGQQHVTGERIKEEFNDRTLPHFPKFDDGLEAKGFVKNSYIKGLEPHEFFFHAIKGREGLIDTAVKTSESGYQQRKLVKALEDLSVAHDYTVRDKSGNVVQFLYGQDGIDPVYLERQNLPYASMKSADMKKEYLISSEDDDALKSKLTKTAYENTKKHYSDYEKYFKQIITDKKHLIVNIFNNVQIDGNLNIFINIDKIFLNTVFPEKGASDLTPMYVLTEIDKLITEIGIRQDNENREIYAIVFRGLLNPKNLILKKNCDQQTFEEIVDKIKNKYYNSLIHPGEMVGIVTAQSYGEYATQATLDTFKGTSRADSVLTLSGVPRVKEILSFTKSMKAPSMTIYTTESHQSDEQFLKLKNDIELSTIGSISKSIKLIYGTSKNLLKLDPSGQIKEQQDIFKSFDPTNFDKKWMVVVDIDKSKLINYEHGTLTIMEKLLENLHMQKNAIHCTVDTSEKILFMVSPTVSLKQTDVKATDDINSEDIISDLIILKKKIADIKINGFDNIIKTEKDVVKGCYYSEKDEEFADKSDFVIKTSGSNLLDVLGMEGVDISKTVTNDLHDVLETLGIEAAKNAILDELYLAFGSKEKKDAINYRHALLLADFSTFTGRFVSFDRSGFSKSDAIGPLARASFEESSTQLVKSGVFAELDDMKSLSSNIMFGQTAKNGTEVSEMILDYNKLHMTEPNLLPVIHEEETDEELADDESHIDCEELDLNLDEVNLDSQMKMEMHSFDD